MGFNWLFSITFLITVVHSFEIWSLFDLKNIFYSIFDFFYRASIFLQYEPVSEQIHFQKFNLNQVFLIPDQDHQGKAIVLQ